MKQARSVNNPTQRLAEFFKPSPLTLKYIGPWAAGLILLVLLLLSCIRTEAQPAPAVDKVCIDATNLVQAIGDARDSGTPQTDLIKQTLDAELPVETQLRTIRLIDRIYTDPTLSRTPPRRLAAEVWKNCMRKHAALDE